MIFEQAADSIRDSMRLSVSAQRAYPSLDQDVAIATQRLAAWNLKPGARIGDIVIHENTSYRIAYTGTDIWPHDPGEVVMQFSTGGTWYLAKDHMEYAGGLHWALNMTLAKTRKTRLQECWFFHNDQWKGDNSVTLKVPVRVFVASNVREIRQPKEKLIGPLGRYT